jgi:hypothetical protein
MKPKTQLVVFILLCLISFRVAFAQVKPLICVQGPPPVITWPNPAPIPYGTPLSATQLDATANMAGTFVYTPAAGTVLAAGSQTLSVTFTPSNKCQQGATDSVPLTVIAGSPLTYPARTDTCVHGYGNPYYNSVKEICSQTSTKTGESGSAMSYQDGPCDALPFARLDGGTSCQTSITTPSVMNTSFVDPDFGPYTFFATDNITTGITWKNSPLTVSGTDAMGIGAPNDIMMRFQSDAGPTYLTHVVESRVLNKTCQTTDSTSNPLYGRCSIPSSLVQKNNCTLSATYYSGNDPNGNPYCTNLQFGGVIAFSRSHSDAPNTFFNLSVPQVFKTIPTSSVSGGFPTGTGDTLARSLLVDFTSDNPVPCSVLPSDYNAVWKGVYSFSDTGDMSIALGGGGSYQTIGNASGGAQVLTTDTFIMPPTTHNNPDTQHGFFMFWVTTPGSTQAPVSGTCSGGAVYEAVTNQCEPNWKANCPTQGTICTDGTVKWTNIGKISGQDDGFDVVYFNPTRGCSRTNTWLGRMYRGHDEGSSWPASGTPDAGCTVASVAAGIDCGNSGGNLWTDDATSCYTQAGSNCGNGGLVQFMDRYTLHDTGNATSGGYSRSAPGSTGSGTFGGVNNNWTGSGGGNYPQMSTTPNGSCTGPVAHGVFPNFPNTQWVSGFGYGAGQWAADPNQHIYYTAKNAVSSTTPPSQDANPTTGNWRPANYMCEAYITDWLNAVGGHPMIRPQLIIGPNYGAGGGHPVLANLLWAGGAYWSHYLYAPNCDVSNSNPLGTVPYCPYVASPNPGLKIMPQGLPSDFHSSYGNVGIGGDLQPIPLFTSAVPNWGSSSLGPCSGLGQTNCSNYLWAGYGEVVAIATTPPGPGEQTLYRFGHNWASGSVASFNGSNTTGAISQDGLIMCYSSDFINTRGDASIQGGLTCQHPYRAMYNPTPNGQVTLSDIAMVLDQYKLYRATSCPNNGSGGTTCAEGATSPTWCTTVGCQVTDGTVTWTYLGTNTCRTDIACMNAVSAQPAP